MSHIEGCPRPGCYVANCRCPCHEPYTSWMRENNEAVQVPVVETQDRLEERLREERRVRDETRDDAHHPSCCGACDICLRVCTAYHGRLRRKDDPR